MRGRAARALIVEDDRAWREILTEILRDMGFEVDAAEDLTSAEEAIRRRSHRIAFADLSLSGDHRNRDGLQVLEMLRRHDPGCVPVLLSGYMTVDAAVEAMKEHGAYTCLQKESFRRSEVRKLIREALAEAPPRAKESSTNRRPAGKTVSSGGHLKGTALVVEDDPGWREVFAELLGDAGFAARTCASLGEALGLLRRRRFSIAVVDLSLASSISPRRNADGQEVLRETASRSIPTIVVSGTANGEAVKRLYSGYDVFAYFEKQSFDRSAFVRTVVEATSGRYGGIDSLTPRELEVLELLAQGATNKEIAEKLVISTNTVKRHLKSIFQKLEVNTRSAAAAKAVEAGLGSTKNG